jgi:hypothetical protein
MGRRDVKRLQGRSKNIPETLSPPFSKKTRTPEQIPYEETYRDNVGHFPMYKDQKLRCKKKGYGVQTIYNMHLYFVIQKKKLFLLFL